MNFRQLVFHNVLRNGRTYASYFLSSLFSVMAFFVFALLYYHPALLGGQDVQSTSGTLSFLATAGMKISQVLIVLMSFLFLGYTLSIFLKSRKRDFSIYLMLGMSEKDLRKMIFLENMILGVLSIFMGGLTGMLFSKLILLVSQNVLALEAGLTFYFPLKPILLTVAVYMSLFFIIAAITTWRTQTANLTEMSKSEERPLPEPRTKWYLSLASLLLIGLGYSLVLLFAQLIIRQGTNSSILLLVSGVCLTVVGSYLFFHQNGIRLFTFLRKRPLFLKRTNLLTISNLVYRMKNNATMYFMIAIVAAVAFVGIGVTMALGGQEFALTQENTFAYVYDFSASDEQSIEGYHKENIDFMEQTIVKEGYKPTVIEVKQLGVNYQNVQMQSFNWIAVISLSQYNKLAKLSGQKSYHSIEDGRLMLLATSNGSINEIKAEKLEGKVFKSRAQLADFADEETKLETPITYSYVTERININSPGLAVVSDKMYQEIADQQVEQGMSTYVIHYDDWAAGSQIDQAITTKFEQSKEDNEQMEKASLQAMGKTYDDEFTAAEEEELSKSYSRWFSYSSLYQTWLNTRQGNGMVLLISVLLGAVFFTFSTCILYFRLFGELTKDGAYHRSLHILGFSRSARHKIVTQEMLIMYFCPIVLAILHFGVAMFALKLLIDLPVLTYFTKIVSVYFVFQIAFFFVSRWRYLSHLDFLAEYHD